VTAATQDTAAAHATGDSEVRILLDDITEKDIDLYFTQHLLASERSFEGMTWWHTYTVMDLSDGIWIDEKKGKTAPCRIIGRYLWSKKKKENFASYFASPEKENDFFYLWCDCEAMIFF
jgi:hypothetical protein